MGQIHVEKYFGVVEAVNECYKKMLEIGKCKEVFQRVDGNQSELLTSKSKNDIYYDIMTDDFLKTHYLYYFFMGLRGDSVVLVE